MLSEDRGLVKKCQLITDSLPMTNGSLKSSFNGKMRETCARGVSNLRVSSGVSNMMTIKKEEY